MLILVFVCFPKLNFFWKFELTVYWKVDDQMKKLDNKGGRDEEKTCREQNNGIPHD